MPQTKFLGEKKERKLFMEFSQAFLSLKTTEEATKFLIDLLTKKEITTLSKRLKVAKLLINNKSYREIEGLLHVSHGTISRISEWLLESGEGFKMVVERTKEAKPKLPSSWNFAAGEWKSIKRRYPAIFWPQLLIEELISSANKRQKKKIQQVLEKMDCKSKLYKQIRKLLNKNS